MISKIYSAIPDGYTGHIIEVEGNTSRNLPSFNIVGMANKTIFEARERVRAAINNSNLIFPSQKVTVNLAPAELSKTGSHLDLPIALSVLILSRQLLQEDTTGCLFVGELSLDGFIRPVRGIINIVEAAKNASFKTVYLPKANLDQANLVKDINLIGVNHLSELLFKLRGLPVPDSIVVKNTKTSQAKNITALTPHVVQNTKTDSKSSTPDIYLDEIIGLKLPKRALTIALAGHHNVLFCGPPGSGKTLLARAATNLLPPLTPEEQISITKLYSLSNGYNTVATAHPFRAPHHTASHIAISGGGATAQPGEISLAHHGILFLDELPEFSHSVLESLREPLESQSITISRANHRLTFPADFMLIATMNPCPCGFYNDSTHQCRCTPQQISRYHQKISGPILDRIDLIVNVEKTKTDELFNRPRISPDVPLSEHNVVKNTISECRALQKQRYPAPLLYNSRLTPRDVSVYVKLTTSAINLLKEAVSRLNLSTRAYHKTLKIARTIADLEKSTSVTAEHISEALAFRQSIF